MWPASYTFLSNRRKLTGIWVKGKYALFFCPPLPYTFPALIITLTGVHVFFAAKAAQFLNVFLSIGLTWGLIKTCQLISPKSSLQFGTLFFLTIITAYYKTFAFVRGEPYIVFFAVIMLYYTLLMSIKKQFTTRNAVILGSAMGLCALSRQWGILLFPPVFLFLSFLWIRLPLLRQSIAKTICLCLVLIFVISGWFYFSLKLRYGAFTAFNRENVAAQFSFSNLPLEFYFGLDPGLLFSNPIRPNFPNQFLPIFYSDLWGDYWGYFTIYGIDTREPRFVNGSTINDIFSKGTPPDWLETNFKTIGSYLGRVNLISTFPSALALGSLIFAGAGILRKSRGEPIVECQKELYSFLLLLIGASMVGYFWWIIMYPAPGKGDTVKATYMAQIFPLLSILVGILLEHVKRSSLFFYRLIIGGLCFTFVHNSCAMLTHFQLNRLLVLIYQRFV